LAATSAFARVGCMPHRLLYANLRPAVARVLVGSGSSAAIYIIILDGGQLLRRRGQQGEALAGSE
jgi:hypothetical protein